MKYTSEFKAAEIDSKLKEISAIKQNLIEVEEYLTNLQTAVENKVEKVEGKELSSNDFTDEYKSKVDSLENYDDTAILTAIGKLETNKANSSEVYDKAISDTRFLGINGTAVKAKADGTGANIADNFASVKSDIVVNRTTLGTRCKNMYKPAVSSDTIYSGSVTYSLSNGKITLSGTPSWNGSASLCEKEIVVDKKIFISGWDNLENISYIVALYNTTTESNVYRTIPSTGITIETGMIIKKIYVQRQSSHSGVVNASLIPMMCYADVEDKTYEPYAPSLQEQINALTARISALEVT